MKDHKWMSTQENNSKLYNSIRKYGWKNFEKEIVTIVKCRTEVLELEKFYIAEFDTMKNGLNTHPGGEGGKLGADAPNAVKIRSYDLNTGEERVFECIIDAAEELDIEANSISKVIRGCLKRTQNYAFQRYDPEDPGKPFDIESILTPEEVRKKAAAASKEVKKRAVIGTHETGSTVEFECISDAERALGISCGQITNCCRGNRGSAGGYTWRYKDEEVRRQISVFVRSRAGAPSRGGVYRILEDGTKDVYLSASDAQEKLNVKHIQRAVENGWKTGGYHWYAIDEETYFSKSKRQKNKGAVYRILEDGTRDEYSTSGEAERKLGIKHVRRAVDTGGNAGGYRWYAV